ncbi:MAG: hypothetical protein QM775_10965 [Pirellulales bacterium]
MPARASCRVFRAVGGVEVDIGEVNLAAVDDRFLKDRQTCLHAVGSRCADAGGDGGDFKAALGHLDAGYDHLMAVPLVEAFHLLLMVLEGVFQAFVVGHFFLRGPFALSPLLQLVRVAIFERTLGVLGCGDPEIFNAQGE